MKTDLNDRFQHEIEHGRMLASHDAEAIWNWKTPAGQCRARRRADLIAEGARLAPGQRVLEIGCGTGMFTEWFAQTGARILGVDISADLIAKARQRGLPPERASFLQRPFEECSLDGPFDAVIGSSILHHLDVDAALPKIIDLLKPERWLSLGEPNLLNPQIYLERKFHHWKCFSYTSPDETAFVRWSLARKLGAVGFTNIRIVPRDWLHPQTPAWMIPAVRAMGWVLEHLPGLREFSGSVYIVAQKPHGEAPAVRQSA